jgi:hypothetical protein
MMAFLLAEIFLTSIGDYSNYDALKIIKLHYQQPQKIWID